jgi:hypothetical protein
VHELVLALSDFYVSQETPDRDLPAGVTLPGFQHVARFGTRSKLSSGWQPWMSRWLIGADAGAIATVAAASITGAIASAKAAGIDGSATMAPTSTAAVAMSRDAAIPASLAPGTVAWMATPMHLVAGMTSVHVDRRSILRLDASDQQMLAADFQRVFHDSGFNLQPLEAGDFLMLGPAMPITDAEEPARALGGSLGQHADSSTALRRLGAEIEMWLHGHPVNDTRSRRGEPPVTSLWLWGAGAVTGRGDVGATAAEHVPAADSPAAADGALAFGRDSYLQGLRALGGAIVSPLPQQLADVFGYPQAQRAVLVIEIGVMLQSNPKWTFFEAVAAIDRRFIAPAVEALNRGQCHRLVVLANDYALTLRASDRLKFWRRARPGLSGLQ